MNITCNDRERIFLDGSLEEWAALEQHAVMCASCAEEIRAWKAVSAAAQELRDYQEDVELWSRIESSLIQEKQTQTARNQFGARLRFWSKIPLAWQAALAGAFVVVLALSGVYVVRHRALTDSGEKPFLKNSALAEVERTERDYMKAIDKLAAQARPELDAPSTPLMAGYKEKLMVLDSAIDELRAEAGRNPSNAHLRYELLAMYQEKQETLQEVLETKR
jgi:hypothetical protein